MEAHKLGNFDFRTEQLLLRAKSYDGDAVIFWGGGLLRSRQQIFRHRGTMTKEVQIPVDRVSDVCVAVNGPVLDVRVVSRQEPLLFFFHEAPILLGEGTSLLSEQVLPDGRLRLEFLVARDGPSNAWVRWAGGEINVPRRSVEAFSLESEKPQWGPSVASRWISSVAFRDGVSRTALDTANRLPPPDWQPLKSTCAEDGTSLVLENDLFYNMLFVDAERSTETDRSVLTACILRQDRGTIDEQHLCAIQADFNRMMPAGPSLWHEIFPADAPVPEGRYFRIYGATTDANHQVIRDAMAKAPKA